MRGFRKETAILMYNGTVKNANEIVIGDIIMGDDSTERKVLNVIHSRGKLFKVEPTDSTMPYYCTIDSIFCLKNNTSPKLSVEKGKYPRYRVRYLESYQDEYPNYTLTKLKHKTYNYHYHEDTKDHQYEKAKIDLERVFSEYHEGFPLHELEMVHYLEQKGGFYNQIVFYRTGIEFNNPINQELSPYLLGAWLGDGTSLDTVITNIDQELIDYLYEEANRMGLRIHRGHDTEKGRGSLNYRFTSGIRKEGSNKFMTFLKVNKLLGNKHIPDHYKINTRENRLALLAGLIDTDGHYNIECNYYVIVQKNKVLSYDIAFLIRSLGFWCHIRPVKSGCMYKGEMRMGDYFSISFAGKNLSEIPILLPRKIAPLQLHHRRKNEMHFKANITEDRIDDCYQFELSGNHRFVLADFKVVHD